MKKLVGVITKDNKLILKSSIPFVLAKGYPTHSIDKTVSLTTGTLEYWANAESSTPIYEGDKVEIKF